LLRKLLSAAEDAIVIGGKPKSSCRAGDEDEDDRSRSRGVDEARDQRTLSVLRLYRPLFLYPTFFIRANEVS
jgi:hypothetical protein